VVSSLTLVHCRVTAFLIGDGRDPQLDAGGARPLPNFLLTALDVSQGHALSVSSERSNTRTC
jgi:hypothetical protein